MAGKQDISIAIGLFEQGDKAFLEELRKTHDAERLGAFVRKHWLEDERPFARQMIVDYLRQPMNVYRHEVVVKRLFKGVEGRGDDELMGHFLVVFDRSIRHIRKKVRRSFYETYDTRTEAQAKASQLMADGYDPPSLSEWSGNVYLYASKTVEVDVIPSDTMYRPTGAEARKVPRIEWWQQNWFERSRLFTPRTRRYLRRRAWRYFRNLGKNQPDRYISAISAALKLYDDDDVANEIALLDKWGLVHALFHNSDALECPAKGWQFAEGKGFADLRPAPYFLELWQKEPATLFDLAKSAPSRTVRVWAIAMFRAYGGSYVSDVSIETLFGLLESIFSEVVEFGASLLRSDPRLASISTERWLNLLHTNDPDTLQIICELMSTHLHPDRLTLQDALDIAKARPLPVTRLGFRLVQSKSIASAEEAGMLLQLGEAKSELMRPELVKWARETVQKSGFFDKTWVLDFLDSRFDDVRLEGWEWLTGDPALADDPELWQKLLESPYDDVKLKLVDELEARLAKGEPSLVRFLWASVLVNIHRGGRAKPKVVGQIVERLEREPSEADELLPLLSVALRSVRGPEFRAGLAGVVGLVERRPELEAVVQERFPELVLGSLRSRE